MISTELNRAICFGDGDEIGVLSITLPRSDVQENIAALEACLGISRGFIAESADVRTLHVTIGMNLALCHVAVRDKKSDCSVGATCLRRLDGHE